MIFTIMAFPHPCFGLWQREKCQYWDLQKLSQGLTLELLFPAMVEAMQSQFSPSVIQKVLTLKEPGPLTATRSAQAFSQGYALGAEAGFQAFSLFDLFPESTEVLIDIGAGRWMKRGGESLQSLPENKGLLISALHTSEEETFALAERLARH